jgi:L-aspartate oxidase
MTGATVHAIVVGSGIAGLTVALHAVESGCRVTLVTKDVLEHANTRYAQGGIAGVMFDDDRVEDHVRDTITAGGGLNDPEAVRVLAEEGPARIREPPASCIREGMPRAPRSRRPWSRDSARVGCGSSSTRSWSI